MIHDAKHPLTQEEVNFFEFFKTEFFQEAHLLVEECCETFSLLNASEGRPERLKRLSQIFHVLQGSSSILGLAELTDFIQRGEELLALARLHPTALSQEIQSLMLTLGDALKDYLKAYEQGRSEEFDIESLKLKVSAAAFRLKGEGDSGRMPKVKLQNINNDLQQGSSTSSITSEKSATLKIDVERVETILDLVGELMVINSQLGHHKDISLSSDSSLRSITALLDKTLRELQDKSMSMRMTPLKGLFLKVQRATRDLSIKLGRPINFIIEGEETELDRHIVESLADPLIHIARNAIDHGIESKDDRAAANKPPKACITLSAKSVSGRGVIEIRDDGRGVAKDKVVARAIEKGFLPKGTNPTNISEREIYSLLFRAGFSTAARVSDISGRGVGLDVAKGNIEKLRGSIEIESHFGKGTCFRLSFPLTTAITDGLMLAIGGQRFVMPMGVVKEIVKITDKDVTVLDDGRSILDVRGEMLPLLSIQKLLFNGASSSQSSTAVVVYYRNMYLSLACDEVLGQTQVVQKSLGPSFAGLSGISGGAILSDGNVALVLDIDSLCDSIRDEPPLEEAA